MISEKTILIVEDDKNLGATLQEYLATKCRHSLLATDGESALELFEKHSPHIILMDIGLPDTTGLELARTMGEKRQDFFLLFLSAQNDPEIKVEGLEAGAEDYITKPFALKELMFRLEKITRHSHSSSGLEEIRHGNLIIRPESYEVVDGEGNTLALSQKECAILMYLYHNRDRAITRDEIIEKVWGENQFPSNRTVDNYIVKLRKWCETDSAKTLDIRSIRGIGYQLHINQ